MLGCVRMLLLQLRSFHGPGGQGGRFVGFNDGLLRREQGRTMHWNSLRQLCTCITQLQ